ncbi:hypothetical protein VMCG_03232 [Cytospora schulzeri]|uniref:Uncharacterized protein n=1 Tax=Cytospora schulzeri TaxID=448051 RepID=A0A423WYA2_9PEZI|nr:hypothetical protein VMCG_03232 [Valsa malicola]
MDNPFRPPNKGAIRHSWSQTPKKKKQNLDQNGLPVPDVPPPDPNTYYYKMTGAYNNQASSSSQPDKSQPSQAFQPNNNPQKPQSPQNAVAGQEAPPYKAPGVTYWRPTDPKSVPQYVTSGPLAAYRPAQPKKPPAFPYIPAQPPIIKPEPRLIPAARTGPGQYMPVTPVRGRGRGFAGGLRPIQDKQEENPFVTPDRSGSTDCSSPPRDTDSDDRRFLKSLIDSHEDDCSDFEPEPEPEPRDTIERLCKRYRSLSPSVLKKDRVVDNLAQRVKELKGEIEQLKQDHEMEIAEMKRDEEKKIADVKSRAVKDVMDAVQDICGIEISPVVWELMVREVQGMFDAVSAVENEGETS